jgi:hypothetical protein
MSLLAAVNYSSIEVICMLLDAGADLNNMGWTGSTTILNVISWENNGSLYEATRDCQSLALLQRLG